MSVEEQNNNGKPNMTKEKALAAADGIIENILQNTFDSDLPELHRTEANYWRAEYYKQKMDLQAAHRGIERLVKKVKRLEHEKKSQANALETQKYYGQRFPTGISFPTNEKPMVYQNPPSEIITAGARKEPDYVGINPQTIGGIFGTD